MDRAQILAEIKRCADANGGLPLGRARFEAESGVSEADWLGRYWARWGDAVQEAGYAPNSLRQPLDDGAVLESLAIFMKELGRFPTSPERKMRRRVDPTFPSHNVFARFGSRAQLAARVARHCDGREDMGDVREICSAAATSVAAEEEPAVVTAGGVVYLMRSGSYFKIGRSNSAGRRAYELAIQLPERLELVHAIETDDPVGIERYWHQRFVEKRLNGEWFALTRADVAAFRRRKRFM